MRTPQIKALSGMTPLGIKPKAEKRLAWSIWIDDEFQGICTDYYQVEERNQNTNHLSYCREEMTFDRMCALMDDDATETWNQCQVVQS